MHDDRGYRSPSIVSLSSRARGVRFVGGKVKVHELNMGRHASLTNARRSRPFDVGRPSTFRRVAQLFSEP